MINSAYSRDKVGSVIRRLNQVSNGANVNNLVANTTLLLPLNGDGTNNKQFNIKPGFGSADLANDWFDIRNLHDSAHLSFRVTVSNNVGGGTTAITNCNIILRFIPNLAVPGTFFDAPSLDVTVRGQGQFVVTAYRGTDQGVQICMRTSTNENVRLHGVYLSIDDIVPIVGGL